MEILLGLGVGTLILLILFWLAPIILIALSDRTSGFEKFFWIFLVVFFSWFSWILYLLIAPVNKEEKRP
jgi:hypothetical protein